MKFLIIGIIVGAAAMAIFNSAAAFIKKRAISQRLKKGIEAEKEAKIILEKNGYKIEEYQKNYKYTISQNQKSVEIDLRPDFLVSKHGKSYIAEVKYGEYVSNISSRETRRQLLEYCFALNQREILLVDVMKREISSIKFESEREKILIHQRKILTITVIILLLGLGLILFFMYKNK